MDGHGDGKMDGNTNRHRGQICGSEVKVPTLSQAYCQDHPNNFSLDPGEFQQLQSEKDNIVHLTNMIFVKDLAI